MLDVSKNNIEASGTKAPPNRFGIFLKKINSLRCCNINLIVLKLTKILLFLIQYANICAIKIIHRRGKNETLKTDFYFNRKHQCNDYQFTSVQ